MPSGAIMSSGESNPATNPVVIPAKCGVGHKLARILSGAGTNFTFIGNAAFIGFLGTLIAGFLQYFSAYQDKVKTLAKEDLVVATAALTDTLNAVALPLSLQERLVFAYLAGTSEKVKPDERVYAAASARAMLKPYEDAFTALRDNSIPLATKMELYLDLPTDPRLNPAEIIAAGALPLTVPLLGYFNFDCDRNMPSFANGQSTLRLQSPAGDRVLDIDWYSARQHFLTLEYCLEDTHIGMSAVLQWASSTGPRDQAGQTPTPDIRDFFVSRFKGQLSRFNDFLSLAIYDIEKFRAKYQPNGLACSLPVVSDAIDAFGHTCSPDRKIGRS
jgi:hypothetical protein